MLAYSKSAPGSLAPLRTGRAPRGAGIRTKARHDATVDHAVRTGVSELLQDVMQELLCQRPEQPERFMSEYFAKRHRVAQGAAAQATVAAAGSSLFSPAVGPALAFDMDASHVLLAGELAPLQAGVAATGRRFFVGGNWKCGVGGRANASALLKALAARDHEVPRNVQVVLFPSVLHLQLASELLPAGGSYEVGAQNAWEGLVVNCPGSVSAEMLREAGVGWVMLGHSDRRNRLGESAELVGTKVAAALEAGLHVNLTVGETAAQRAEGVEAALAALTAQLQPAVEAVAATVAREAGELLAPMAAAETAAALAKLWGRVVLAYEPVWAIGKGATPCTPEQAQEVHAALRAYVSARVSAAAAEHVRIAYTGSVSVDNCLALAAQPDIDGFICGRASLDAKAFLTVCKSGA